MRSFHYCQYSFWAQTKLTTQSMLRILPNPNIIHESCRSSVPSRNIDISERVYLYGLYVMISGGREPCDLRDLTRSFLGFELYSVQKQTDPAQDPRMEDTRSTATTMRIPHRWWLLAKKKLLRPLFRTPVLTNNILLTNFWKLIHDLLLLLL